MINSKQINVVIAIVIIFITVVAFMQRMHNFKGSTARTIDEAVYFRMALQINENVSDYNTIPYGDELRATGRSLPKYFALPLFKHPPVFTYGIATFTNIFGAKWSVAAIFPILMGVLLIPLTFLLGSLVYSRMVGLFAALCMFNDPIGILSSQKIWMDTTIAFFSVLAVYFFLVALKHKVNIFYILSGLASGIAVNTKYTGILVVFGIGLYALVNNRYLFTKKSFWISMLLPFVMLLPWIYWNYSTYGIDVLTMQVGTHGGFDRFLKVFVNPYFLIFIISCVFLAIYFYRRKIALNAIDENKTDDPVEEEIEIVQNKIISVVSICFVGFIFIVLLKDSFLNALNYMSIPSNSWQLGFFRNEPPWFYLGRLVEYSLIYTAALFVLLRYQPKENQFAALLRITSLVVLLFFIAWRGYQSRYILTLLPFLLVLASDFIVCLWKQIEQIKNLGFKQTCRFLILFFVVYAFIKTAYINQVLSFPNNTCYF